MSVPIKVLWSETENEAFFEAIRKHGRDYDKIQKEVSTKHRTQIVSKCYHEFERLIKCEDNKEKIDILNILKQKQAKIAWRAYEN